jgi:predicted O-methyltransferase YrrM
MRHTTPCTTQALLKSIIASLNSISPLEPVWRSGVVHKGGPHYRLRGTAGPASIGEDECLILGDLIAHFEPVNCFIIGNGFGLSSVWIAKLMENNGGRSVVTLDNHSEGDGQRCFAVAEELRTLTQSSILRNRYGISPQDLVATASGDLYDLIFIDGGHSHPQVTADFHGVQPLLVKKGILCWHDYWLAGVAASVAEAEHAGYRCLKVNSSCEMVFGTRDEEVFREMKALFSRAEAPSRRRHPCARLKLTLAYLTAKLR